MTRTPTPTPTPTHTRSSLSTTDRYGYSGVARLRVFDVGALQNEWSCWNDFPREIKRKATRLVSAKREITQQNKILDNFFDGVNINLDRNTDGSDLSASHLAIGDVSSTVPDDADTLNNEVHRTIVGETDRADNDLITSTLIGQGEAVGEDIKEIGLAPGPDPSSDAILTHIALDSVNQVTSKSSDEVVTVDYTLLGQR